MPLLAALALVTLAPARLPSLLPALLLGQDDRDQTLGRTYAQILAMGEARWTALYAKERGDSTPAIAAGFITYGDALSWRNDRLLKGKASPLRKPLTDFSDGLQGVGVALTEGGTIWQIFAGQSYRDVEVAVYRVITHTGTAPRRVTSDVERALAPYARLVAGIEDPKRRKEAAGDLALARAAWGRIAVAARRLSRRDSDTVLEFCRNEARSVLVQAHPL